jgi:hypothetical protein
MSLSGLSHEISLRRLLFSSLYKDSSLLIVLLYHYVFFLISSHSWSTCHIAGTSFSIPRWCKLCLLYDPPRYSCSHFATILKFLSAKILFQHWKHKIIHRRQIRVVCRVIQGPSKSALFWGLATIETYHIRVNIPFPALCYHPPCHYRFPLATICNLWPSRLCFSAVSRFARWRFPLI